MNDPAEFKYARDLVFDSLNEFGSRGNFSKVSKSLAKYVGENLRNWLNDTTKVSSAYCACLTFSPDDSMQWETYAENGNGFAVGLNGLKILRSQTLGQMMGEPFVYCGPVIYKGQSLVADLVEAGVQDLEDFAATCSERPQDLTDLRDRAMKEIVLQLLVLINFLKGPAYISEREMRLFLDPNNGTLEASNVQHYEQDNERIPFIFMNLCSPSTSRLPLAEIKIGPNAVFGEKRRFAECLLDELGYGSNFIDRPQITRCQGIGLD